MSVHFPPKHIDTALLDPSMADVGATAVSGGWAEVSSAGAAGASTTGAGAAAGSAGYLFCTFLEVCFL